MRQRKRISCLGLFALAAWLTPFLSSAASPPPQTGAGEKNQPVVLSPAKEELLRELPSTFEKAGEASWVFGDASHEHYAYAAKRGKKWVMVADGKEGPEFIEVDSPRFSADGQHFAYRGVSQRAESAGGLFIRWKMVVDGKEGQEFDELSVPVFSPDSQHLAYRGKRTPTTEAREVLIFDGKEMKESEYASQVKLETMTREFDYEGQPVFSPDGRHWAYRARRKKNKEIMLVDGKESPEFEEITHPLFSPDSLHFAYRAKLKKNQEVILLDGKETTEFDAVTNPVFSPDSRRLAYLAKREKKWHMILDGQEGPEIEKAGSYGPLFSPDSQHVVYLSLRMKPGLLGSSWEVSEIRDGTASGLHHFENCRERYLWFESSVFSPNGQKLAYVLWQSKFLGAYEEAVKLRMFESVVLVPYQEPYADRCVVVDGRESKIYDGTLGIDVKFSPDSQHFTYAVHRRKNSTVVVDGQEGKLYDDVIGGAFSEVANGNASPQHAFLYIGRDARKFYRVTQPLP
jgi:rRNA maturation protein Nop10